MRGRLTTSDAGLGLLLAVATVLAGLLAIFVAPVGPTTLGFAQAGRLAHAGPAPDLRRAACLPLPFVASFDAPCRACLRVGASVALDRAAARQGSTFTASTPRRV